MYNAYTLHVTGAACVSIVDMRYVHYKQVFTLDRVTIRRVHYILSKQWCLGVYHEHCAADSFSLHDHYHMPLRRILCTCPYMYMYCITLHIHVCCRLVDHRVYERYINVFQWCLDIHVHIYLFSVCMYMYVSPFLVLLPFSSYLSPPYIPAGIVADRFSHNLN